MAVSLRKLARAAHQNYPTLPRTQWVTLHPSQLVLLISQVGPLLPPTSAVLLGLPTCILYAPKHLTVLPFLGDCFP